MKFPKESPYVNAIKDGFKINKGLVSAKPQNSFDFKNSDTFFCIPGILAFPKFMEGIGDQIKAKGNNIMYLNNRRPNNNIHKTNEEIISIINKNKDNIPNNGDIILVGHSMGAVSHILCSINKDFRSKIKGVISLSPAFDVDEKSRFMPFKNVREFFHPKKGNVKEKVSNANSDFLSQNGTFHHVYTTDGDIIMPVEAQKGLSNQLGVKTFETGSNHHCVYQKYPEIFVPEMIKNINEK